MKKTSLALLTLTMILSGCSSTPNSNENVVIAPKPLEIASLDEYKWDKNISLAANFAKLAQPAGVGFGLQDSVNPKKVTIGRSESSLLSAAGGFMLGGFGAAAGNLAMDSKTNEMRDWQPAFITFYDEIELNLNDPIAANKFVREDVAKKVHAALLHKYPDTKLEGVFERRSAYFNNAVVVYSGEVCNEAIAFGKLPELEYSEPRTLRDYVGLKVEDSSDIPSGCLFIFGSKISHTVSGRFAVVSEANNGSDTLFIIEATKPYLKDIALLVPDQTPYYVFGSRRKHIREFPYPAVYRDMSEFLFSSNEKSDSSQIFQ
ncbi:hypothetical protein [Pseudoalteromonas xiamenensis]